MDEGPAFRAAARGLLAAMTDFALAGEARTGDEAIELVRGAHPDLALVDVRTRGMEGIETARRLREAEPELVVVLVAVDDPLRLPAEVGFCGAAEVLRKQDLSAPLLRRLWSAHRRRGRTVP